jgi:hypothetical protein
MPPRIHVSSIPLLRPHYKSPSCDPAIGAGCLPRASVQVSTFPITHYSFEFLFENALLPHKRKRTFLDVQNVASSRLATWQVLKLYRVHRRHPLPATPEAPAGSRGMAVMSARQAEPRGVLAPRVARLPHRWLRCRPATLPPANHVAASGARR